MPDSTDPRQVRIPLIKTAAGERAYDVVLKYGGDMPPLGAIGSVDFPMIHCENIRPELSQAWLYLPEQYRWFGFGGTMHPVAEEADLEAGYVQFQTKQIGQSVAALREGDKWTKARAANNLQTSAHWRPLPPQTNMALQSELAANNIAVKEAQKEVELLNQTKSIPEVQDNRQRLMLGYRGQVVTRSRNVVGETGVNFSIDRQARQQLAEQTPPVQPPAQQVMGPMGPGGMVGGMMGPGMPGPGMMGPGMVTGKGLPAATQDFQYVEGRLEQQEQVGGEGEALKRYERRLAEQNNPYAAGGGKSMTSAIWTGGGTDYGAAMGRHVDVAPLPPAEKAAQTTLPTNGWGPQWRGAGARA